MEAGSSVRLICVLSVCGDPTEVVTLAVFQYLDTSYKLPHLTLNCFWHSFTHSISTRQGPLIVSGRRPDFPTCPSGTPTHSLPLFPLLAQSHRAAGGGAVWAGEQRHLAGPGWRGGRGGHQDSQARGHGRGQGSVSAGSGHQWAVPAPQRGQTARSGDCW